MVGYQSSLSSCLIACGLECFTKMIVEVYCLAFMKLKSKSKFDINTTF